MKNKDRVELCKIFDSISYINQEMLLQTATAVFAGEQSIRRQYDLPAAGVDAPGRRLYFRAMRLFSKVHFPASSFCVHDPTSPFVICRLNLCRLQKNQSLLLL